jgi:hypothetical protein
MLRIWALQGTDSIDGDAMRPLDANAARGTAAPDFVNIGFHANGHAARLTSYSKRIRS